MANSKGRTFKLICKNCNKEFDANTSNTKYCNECDLKLNYNKCIICGKPVRKKVCCSKECLAIHRSRNNPSKREDVRQKLKETAHKGIEAAKKSNLEKYGVEYPFQNKEIQEKVRKTQGENHNGKLTWNDKSYKTLQNNETFGFLRETQKIADKAGIESETGLHRTGLDTYLKIIFPNIHDWVHDEQINLNGNKLRPDYRSESLKIIIEVDGLPHYQFPDIILNDKKKDELYIQSGYKVIRIPYFIQLTNETVYKMFNVKVNIPLFNSKYHSLSPKSRNTPAYLCLLGIKRMAEDFIKYKEQYKVNENYLLNFDNELTGLNLLKEEMNKIIKYYK